MAKASVLPSSVSWEGSVWDPLCPARERTGSCNESGARRAGGEVLGVRKRKKATDVGGLQAKEMMRAAPWQLSESKGKW